MPLHQQVYIIANTRASSLQELLQGYSNLSRNTSVITKAASTRRQKYHQQHQHYCPSATALQSLPVLAHQHHQNPIVDTAVSNNKMLFTNFSCLVIAATRLPKPNIPLMASVIALVMITEHNGGWRLFNHLNCTESLCRPFVGNIHPIIV